MKLCCLSDYHSQFRYVTPSLFEPHDVTVFTGDWTGPRAPHLARAATLDFLEWLSQLPSRHQILIAGNHDRTPIDDPIGFRQMVSQHPSIIYLENESTTIDNIVFYGSPYTPPFFDWHFMAQESELLRMYASVPSDTAVLLTHGPAFGILDETDRGVSAGSLSLAALLPNLPSLRLHVFGHIHEAHGTQTIDTYTAVNASQLDSIYTLKHTPIYIEL